MAERVYKVRTLFPLYSIVRQLLTIFDGLQKQTVTSIINAIMDQTGTPQNPVDWSDPDTWIEGSLPPLPSGYGKNALGGNNFSVNQ